MQERKLIFGPSSMAWVIILGAALKFTLHLYMAPGYGFFGDEFYTIALSKHLAFGYVDLPPLVPLLMALSRALLGESLFALHIVPALAGSATLVFVCLIAKEFGAGKFAVMLSALWFIFVPLWLSLDSIFCYDCIDQLILAGFLYTLVRFLRGGNKRLWVLLGLIAGLACMTKMTMLFMGPGFLTALLLSKYRKDLLTPWPWLGAALCVLVVSPYLFWQAANQWPTLEYWNNYGTLRVYEASIPQYLTNILMYMNLFFLPLWLAGFYRIFRPINGVDYSFLGVLFLVTLLVLFILHASVRMLGALFIPVIAAGSLFVEEILACIRWENGLKTAITLCLLAAGIYILPSSLPILPLDRFPSFYGETGKFLYQSIREFNGAPSYYPLLLSGRIGWEKLTEEVAGVYDALPAQDRAVAGVYADHWMDASAIDVLGPAYGLPHAVSGSLTYYLWGPGYSWDVMIVITARTNPLAVFFDECELQATAQRGYDESIRPVSIFLCRHPKVSAEKIWSSMKSYR